MKCSKCKKELRYTLGYMSKEESPYPRWSGYDDAEIYRFSTAMWKGRQEGGYFCKYCGNRIHITDEMAERILSGG